MKSKKMIGRFISFSLVVATATAFAKELTVAERKAAKAAALQSRIEDDGGEVIRPGSMRGWILFADGQTLVDPYELEEVRDLIWDWLSLDVRVVKSEKVTPDTVAGALKKSGANLGVFLTEDENTPTLLVAPEDRWAIVNVAKLKEGAKNDKYVVMRVKKELVRGFVACCGGLGSSYGAPICAAITKPADLDRCATLDLPIDVLMRFNKYLRGYGVTPAERTPYIYALDEKWCPPPVNKWQQKIKDEMEARAKAEAEKKAGKPATASNGK